MTPQDKARLAAAGITLPPLSPPIGTFLTAVESGGLLWVSGQAPLDATGRALTGKVGPDITPAEARRRAGLAAAALLASVATEPGRLSRLRRPVRVFGLVNAPADFTEIHAVLDGCHEVLLRMFPQGHAATAIAVQALPNNITVEIEAVFEMET